MTLSVSKHRARTGIPAIAITLMGGVAGGVVGAVAVAPDASASVSARPSVQHRPAVVGKGLTLSPSESRLLTLVNKARAKAHLKALTAEAGPTDVARRWSLHLADEGALSHNPSLVAGMQSAGSSQWHTLSENVGEAPSGQADRLFASYMASPAHRANILSSRARYVGIGTVDVTGPSGRSTAWNTMTFTDAYSTRYGKARTAPVAPLTAPDLRALAGTWSIQL